MQTTRFATTGMHCNSCSMLIQMTLEEIDGIESVASNAATGITEVVHDPAKVSADDIIAEIVKAGYGAEPLA
jgi:copper chaperone CopZ